MKSLTLEGTERAERGTTLANRMRRAGSIPCVIYGGSETVHFQAPYNAFQKIVFNPDFFTVKITVNGKEYTTIVKEVQFHPVTDKITHIDFLELTENKKVTAEIPVKLHGQSAGVRAGGVLDQKMRKLKVKAFPKDLVEQIDINIETLELGKSIKVADIKVANVEILNVPYLPIVATYIPRAVEEKPVAAAVTTEAAAPAAEGAAKAGEGDKKGDAKAAAGKAPAKAEKKPEAKK